ncbi:16S rRNA (adenine(1518)-N(6)/adenine(1519)-N(6))-dimethyltransferase RsmA [Bacteroidales bacterium OttesenSCG-928-B11]|nr:16S rRNA (adenine(1518)-N(6)/adenine(1519)-N(6))-dimethyltransferase RsmA [Bacteroidales bacterium OttesenSCG-928-C03]MDL2311820.1 16S rRNA (adenine(1518)-N(6)/adenine(1519)-N(6))-dimethyltransferase RsmA [Bacteroidales bacterium OttesenSCG-928-B11]MDL2325531.1 16S rRNA (adenine(1518)-N(6)/adenine(1519)-N(6))-dimethyltransferase RsmA [Bacteroidales bacterium OttesenSCG-928-A14]
MNVKPKKRLGQHFLRNEQIAEDIANSLITPNPNLIEIGPGMGVLTKYLMKRPNVNFSVVELDEESVRYLQQQYPDFVNNIIADDFLKLDLAEMYNEPLSIIGNFPYNISSQILFKLLDYKDLATELVGMFQKEVAERVAAKPGNKNYGILTVLIQAFYDVEYLFTVHEYEFDPPPKVKSAVIRVVKNNEKQLHCDEVLFKKVVKTAFNQRRKTLRNSLKTFSFNPEYQSDPIFNKRPEQLSVKEFEEICIQISH